MQFARLVRSLGVLLALGVTGFGGGCGERTSPFTQEDTEKLQVSHKGAHAKIKEDRKAVAKQVQQQQGASRKGAHRGAGGR